MKISKDEKPLRILLDNRELDRVSKFQYLGSLINREMRARIYYGEGYFQLEQGSLHRRIEHVSMNEPLKTLRFRCC